MSEIHTLIFNEIMKSKTMYSPDRKVDYEKKRKEERQQTKQVPLPENIAFTEEHMGGVSVELVTAENNPKDRMIYYIHGGGFIYGEPATRRFLTSYFAGTFHCNVAAVDYRLAPEFPYPAGALDCIAVYEALLKQYDSKKIVFVGESAGGNLVLSTLLRAKERKLPLPAAVFAVSPTVQYDQVFPSYTENADSDCMIGNLSDEVCDVYLQSKDPAVLKDPFAAPYYGDYSGCPPIFLWASGSEVLLDDSVFLYEKLKAAGQDCELYIRDHMMHGYLTTPAFPEAQADLQIMKQRMDAVMDGQRDFGNRRITLQ